jgi:hypothetical protein
MSSIDEISKQKDAAGKNINEEKPNLPKWLFWDVRYDEMDWRRCYQYVIQRILDRGDDQELAELVRFYGRRKVLHVLKKKPIYLMDHSIERACTFRDK